MKGTIMVSTAHELAATSPINTLFGWTEGRTWRSILYLLLAFPLGIAYFVFLATGIALGTGLAITLLGLPILALTLLAWRQFGRFERLLMCELLGESIPGASARPAGTGIVERLKADLKDGFTWRSLVYLVAEFPFGIASFTVVVTLLSLGLALATSPLSYRYMPGDGGPWSIDSLPKSLVAFVLGLALLAITPRLLNGITRLWAAFAHVMLVSR
jgi:hypothetical protein